VKQEHVGAILANITPAHGVDPAEQSVRLAAWHPPA
jgi:hypothetical protein